MNRTNRHEIQERISQASARVAEVAEQCTALHAQMEPISAARSAVEEQIRARDWVLTGVRPGGCNESTKEASEKRSRLHVERNRLTTQLSDLQKRITPLSRQLSELRDDLHMLQQSSITPASVQSEIDRISRELAEFESERATLASVLFNAEEQLSEISEIERDEADATERLAEARANSFLAVPPATAALRRGIAEAEKALDSYRDKALGARAARPMVIIKIESAQQDLRSIDGKIEQHRIRLEEKQSQLWRIEAQEQWAELMSLIRAALRKRIKRDQVGGRALVEALMHEGLREFDAKGRMVRPDWLQSGATGLSNI